MSPSKINQQEGQSHRDYAKGGAGGRFHNSLELITLKLCYLFHSMRVWDIHPGYLNRQSLLGEHREIHGLINILNHGKKGYSRHPETLRWKDHIGAALLRHEQLVAEMSLRGYRHFSPVSSLGMKITPSQWPDRFIDTPGEQFRIRIKKYIAKEQGRIPLPSRKDQLWAQHKYSILARSPTLYAEFGKRVILNTKTLDELALELVLALRTPPTPGRLRNAVEHLWGYFRFQGPMPDQTIPGLKQLAHEAYTLKKPTYVLHSTALSDLASWSELIDHLVA